VSDPLSGVWLKIERAQEHRDSLLEHIAKTNSIPENRPRLGVKFETDSGEYVLFVNHMPELSAFLSRASIILGDIVHNLISSLDRLAYQLALRHTCGKIAYPNRVQFPIADAPNRFAELRKRSLTEIDPVHVAIIERFQGYHRVGEVSFGPYFHPLSKLRDLASADKHREPVELVIPTTAWSMGAGEFDTFRQGALERFFKLKTIGDFAPAELGAEVMRAILPSGAVQSQMDVEAYVPVDVAIGHYNPVVGAVDNIAAVVLQIVREFEPLF
jgi:hypothetical protein